MSDEISPDEPLPTRTEAEGATVDLPEGLGFFSTGQVLGERYEILEMLGRGGMGEVWRAFDLKLRVEVALKALRDDLFQNELRLELLRQEVRAAREVMSPNVCRIFDLHEFGGRELVSMEYVDGATLLGVLQDRGPLELKEAQDIASQFLSGLEAIHKVGLVHRDVKPENIMLTRAGRVVVMDFGLARGPESGAGSVSGTPAYMAPEHTAGQEVDARADVYSAGVVLAEMVSPEGIKSYESRQSVWEGVRSEPAQIPDSPWSPVIKRAVARDRERRQNSAHTLIRELEDVTLRVEGAEDLHPYPGLASFTESDAEYFFGREAEVETIWRRIEGAHLLAIVGPSGAGKTSFIAAGLVPNTPPGWAIVRCTPGNAAIPSLARAMAREMAGDADAVEMAVGIDDPTTAIDLFSRWRRQNTEVLLIVDQFEELFTLNASDHQQKFANLLLRLALEANVRVLLSMRDDFLMECKNHEALVPVFEALTPLMPPVGPALRRVLVQPATKCGYRFEDDDLVEEILAEIEGERGALPMLAFAASRLWEKRDRENGLLTRQAYHDIGGVGGALSRHAEATVDKIGVERIPIVRELFRNLMTAEGTRAVREWDELLSVFGDGSGGEGIKPSPTKKAATTTGAGTPHASVGAGLTPARGSAPQEPIVGAGFTPARAAAAEVLRELIDARLLTSYEVREDEHEPIRRVEIIHESLLANWPRLVRWQTQDQEGAQLRDELRQSARAWDEHGRHDDRLWTGTAYREYKLWREHYPGGLTEVEEAFGAAMTRHATRRRRRQRVVVSVGVAALIAVLAVVTGMWRRSVLQERRAEAQKLIALGQLVLEDYPSETLAHAIASLELADSIEARRLALQALWRGPTELRFEARVAFGLQFSADGRWLATAERDGGRIWPSDGGPPVALEKSKNAMEICLSPRGDLVAHTMDSARQTMGLWSVPGGEFLRSFNLGEDTATYYYAFSERGDRLLTSSNTLAEPVELIVRSWPVEGGEPDLLSRVVVPVESMSVGPAIDTIGSRFAWADGMSVHANHFGAANLSSDPLWSVSHDQTIAGMRLHPGGRLLATADTGGTVRVWSLDGDAPAPTHSFSGRGGIDASYLLLNPAGTMLATMGGCLWDLEAPPGADPVTIRGGHGLDFHPNGDWVATKTLRAVSFWPLSHTYPRVLRGHEDRIYRLAFTPDGRYLISASIDRSVRAWPLVGGTGEQPRVLHERKGMYEFPSALDISPDGSLVVVGNPQGEVVVLPMDGGAPRTLVGFTDVISWVGVSPDGRMVAAGSGEFIPEQALIRIWNLETGDTTVLDAGDGRGVTGFFWLPDGNIWAYSKPIARLWDLTPAHPKIVEEYDLSTPEFVDNTMDFDVVGNRVLRVDMREDVNRLWIQDFVSQEANELEEHRGMSGYYGWDIDLGAVITNQRSGDVLVGPITGGEPHLLLGHETRLAWAAFSPDGQWIATGDDEGVIRIWPMPDLSKRPLHTLPRKELIAKLKTLTNLRVVPDPESATGWTLTHDPFPGWETVPTW